MMGSRISATLPASGRSAGLSIWRPRRRELHLVDHGGRGGDQVQVVLALQALLDDLHVEHAEEAAAETEAQGLGDLRLVEQGRVVEAQLAQGVAQVLVIIGHRG